MSEVPGATPPPETPTPDLTGTEPAPESWPDRVWVCGACGKVSETRYGPPTLSGAPRGWDESCFLNSVLCVRASLRLRGGRVVYADAWRPAVVTGPGAQVGTDAVSETTVATVATVATECGG